MFFKRRKTTTTGPLTEQTTRKTLKAIKRAVAPSQLPQAMRLVEMLTYARPDNSDTERAFISHYIDTIPNIETDDYGNRYVTIREREAHGLAFTAHTDTVHRREGTQALSYDPETGLIGIAGHSGASCLGADCTTGIWLMTELIARNVPGTYLFFRSEESGCIGSDHMATHNPELLSHLSAAISLDRYGFSDVITHQCSARTASDAFADSLSAQLGHGYEPSPNGVYTDSNALSHLIAECTNIAVGYYAQHSRSETQHLQHALDLLEALSNLNHSKLDIERDPSLHEYLYTSHSTHHSTQGYDKTTRGTTDHRDMVHLVRDNPAAVADLLSQLGYDAVSLFDELQANPDYMHTLDFRALM